MTYELARQLKEAGFPQKEEVGSIYMTSKGLYVIYPDIFNADVYIPTLSELMAVCGEFTAFTLSKPFPPNPKPHRRWIAQISNEQKEKLWISYNGDGDTPEEAVARLWLALNRKSTPSEEKE